MIEVNNLSRSYGGFKAVDNVSFKIGQGEIVGLLGHNGAGKTTIMKMLTGYIEPSAGNVLIDGVDVQDDPLSVQRQMGYLPESSPIYPELTVADYLTHTAHLRGVAPEKAVPEAIAATRLVAKAFDPIDTLSRGYKQRLGVAQAILHKPKFLVLDEPSNGLDPNQIRDMRLLIKSLAEHATVILSTHIMQEVNAVCDRALILHGGQLVVDEQLDALQTSTLIRVRTAADAALDSVLRNEPNIESVTLTIAGDWQVVFSGDADISVAAIGQKIVQAGLPIFHLASEIRDLESIFAEVNEKADSSTTEGQNAA